jgi:hypothetical protein
MTTIKCEKCRYPFQKKFLNSCPKCKLLKTNNFNCRICNRIFLKLCLHHIDGNHYNDKINNLILCCEKCHLQIHHKKIEMIEIVLGVARAVKIAHYQSLLLKKYGAKTKTK